VPARARAQQRREAAGSPGSMLAPEPFLHEESSLMFKKQIQVSWLDSSIKGYEKREWLSYGLQKISTYRENNEAMCHIKNLY